MKLLCDEMLKGLGRWLRTAGYDTVQADTGGRDSDLLAQAIGEGRLLITRDRKLLEFRGAGDTVIWLPCNALEACAIALARRIDLDWLYRPFTRCLLCNSLLVAADSAAWARVPASARDRGGPLSYCSHCDKLYWEGSHVRRMRRRLAAWEVSARGGPAAMQ